MKPFRILTASQQVAEFLRDEILRGRWQGTMPGRDRLAAQLGAGRETVNAALEQLEEEGLLVPPPGRGRRRRIVDAVTPSPRVLRVKILLYQPGDARIDYMVDLRQRLLSAGHAAEFSTKTLHDLGMSAERVARFVKGSAADAWIVCSGSQELLQWFSGQPVPSFALFGRWAGLPVPGTLVRKPPALEDALRELFALGHQRIAMLVREERRKPQPAPLEQRFLEILASHGIAAGPFHLPDWEESPDGFHRCLATLFAHTPPTALIISEAALFHAARAGLAELGFLAPRDVSLICDDPDLSFIWCQPAISHIAWEPRSTVRRVTRWVDNVARGKTDRRQTFTKARFIRGGTIGPAPAGGPSVKTPVPPEG